MSLQGVIFGLGDWQGRSCFCLLDFVDICCNERQMDMSTSSLGLVYLSLIALPTGIMTQLL